MMHKRVGIYAGSFDPIHNGHVAFAQKAVKECGLDKLFFLPEPRPRYKQGVKALIHRIAMVRLATLGHKKLGIIELNQHRFTVNDTLPVLQQRFQDVQLFFLLGDDKLKRMINWPKVGDLTKSSQFIIATRKGDKKDVKQLSKLITASGGQKFTYQTIVMDGYDISSSDIRKTIKQQGMSDYVEPNVLAYIKRNKLYESAATIS